MSITHEEQRLLDKALTDLNPSGMRPLKESIGNVFQKNITPLKHYVSRFFSSSHDVEDVLQDVFIRVVEAEQKNHIDMPKAFIYKVAKNLALNEKSKASQQLQSFIEPDELEKITAGIALEDLIEQEQRFEHFCSSVNKLPPQCKKVFIMKKVHGLANSEIALQLNISVGTVDKHLAKGLITCRNDLQQLGHSFAVQSDKSVKTDKVVVSNITIKNTIQEADYFCK